MTRVGFHWILFAMGLLHKLNERGFDEMWKGHACVTDECPFRGKGPRSTPSIGALVARQGWFSR